MATRNVAAVDLGAESGRVILARFDGQRVSLEEIHRFHNRPVMLHGHRFWNVLGLWDETLAGLRKARKITGTLDSIGVDTWGVDYGLVDSHGFLLGQPFHYRDHRTDGMMEQVFVSVPRDVLYRRTGIQFLPFNTLFQLYAHEHMQPGELAHAYRLLMIPDLLHNWLCGTLVAERTNATTTQCWDPIAGAWATDLLDQLAIPTTMLAPVVDAGTSLGEVLPELRSDVGMARVVAPATHDTGSAIAATPVSLPGGWGYISSGTWSLVGVELSRPTMTPEALAANCTNEGGVFGTTRFLKNVMGLWLLQECQHQWERDGHSINYDTLLADVDGVPAFAALIDPDDPSFLSPRDMPEAINAYLLGHGQVPLSAPAAFARCIMESLVLRYREVFHQMSRLTGTMINSVHVLGGGARNARLNQWLADALDMLVIAGPYDATALGNALAAGGPGRTARPGGGARYCTESAYADVLATQRSPGCLERGSATRQRTLLDDILVQKELSSRGGIFMTYQITLSEQDYAALAAAAAQSGTEPEQLLHDMIQRLQTSSQRKRSLTAREVAERQYHEGKISHVPTRQRLTPEEREARERRARRFAGGKPASEMVIEDRGPY